MIKEILNSTYKGDINDVFACGFFLGFIISILQSVFTSLGNFIFEKAMYYKDKRKELKNE